jgi:YggT family protein
MEPILLLFYRVIDIYFYILIINIVLSWLVAFNVVNMQNKFVAIILYATNRLTDPLLNPIRRVLPNLGGIDISPIVLVLGLLFIQDYIRFNLYI